MVDQIKRGCSRRKRAQVEHAQALVKNTCSEKPDTLERNVDRLWVSMDIFSEVSEELNLWAVLHQVACLIKSFVQLTCQFINCAVVNRLEVSQ